MMANGSEETPPITADLTEVPPFLPVPVFIRMPSFDPTINSHIQVVIDGVKHMTGYHMTIIVAQPRIFGFSNWIKLAVFAVGWILMISLTLARNVDTFFLAGVMSNLPWYLRTLKPRKSKPPLI